MKRIIIKKMFAAVRGCFLWSRIRHRYLKKDELVILLPDLDEDILFFMLIYLDKYLDIKGMQKAVLISKYRNIEKICRVFSDRVKKVVGYSERRFDDILQLTTVFDLGPRALIASVDRPFERMGRKFLNMDHMNKETVFVLGVLKINIGGLPWGKSDSREMESYQVFKEMMEDHDR